MRKGRRVKVKRNRVTRVTSHLSAVAIGEDGRLRWAKMKKGLTGRKSSTQSRFSSQAVVALG